MRSLRFIFNLALLGIIILFAGCATPPKTVKVSGQIRVSDAGKIQPTGLAPIWIYDATNVQLTAKIPLPNFGGRSRQDWQRIVKAYPKSLTVYSNYAVLEPLGAQAEVKRVALANEYYQKSAALNGRTNGPEFDAVQQVYAEWKRQFAKEDRLWDQADDMRELIVLWYNVNPGLLYADGLPQALATAQTDKKGNFSLDLPAAKKVLIAAHIQGTIQGQPGNYFWLVPFDTGTAATNGIVLNEDNARCKRTWKEMPRVILPRANGYIGSISFGMLKRVRDARAISAAEASLPAP